MISAEVIGLVHQQHRHVLAPACQRKRDQPAREPATQDREVCLLCTVGSFGHFGPGFRPLTGPVQPAARGRVARGHFNG